MGPGTEATAHVPDVSDGIVGRRAGAAGIGDAITSTAGGSFPTPSNGRFSPNHPTLTIARAYIARPHFLRAAARHVPHVPATATPATGRLGGAPRGGG